MESSKILVVDDEPLTCQLISKMLSLYGYTPIVLTDQAQVITIVETEQPDLILMDYYLGSGLGLDTLQQLKADDKTRAIPVILASGIDRRNEAIDAGAAAFLLKPFDWNEFMQIINTTLNGLHAG